MDRCLKNMVGICLKMNEKMKSNQHKKKDKEN